ncbi:U3 small nucleolar ribonucleoprotein protein MPP10, putative [Plasmodium chabaudi chabaudi]|uniref:U3 small nucleolar ribonucleoprotein protein MPP10, putative n=1 Tax=Plasmodium chabaudi chabaudi TaxID=31271 RepID=A0A1C6X871_PLACU|nr:U3 small nucleolar ribonucleoprotein protein MPP10, putative [Plasmodium chabaudi chabaudi]
MDEVRIKKYTDLISSFEKKSELELNSKKCNTEDKTNLLEMIEYFSNTLVKYFYNEKEMDDILISNSDLDYEQLWYFIECLIKEKKLENLSTFFNNFEKKIDKEIEETREKNGKKKIKKKKKKVKFLDQQMDQGKNAKRRKITKSESPGESETEEDDDETKDEDKFFNYEEMQKFADIEDNKFVDNSDEGESDNLSDDLDLNQFELEPNQGGDIRYSDFYKGEEEEDEEEEDEEGEEEEDDEEYDEEEDDEDEEEDEDDEEEDEDEDDEEEDEEGSADMDMEMHAMAQNKSAKSKKMREEADKRLERDLEEMNEYTSKYFDAETSEFEKEKMEKEEIEKELVAKKHWSLIGEVTAQDRPKNSILSLNVDIPKVNTHKNDTFLNKTVGKDFESDEDNGELNNTDRNFIDKKNMLNEEIELVVKQRIKNFLFDDVEKKKIEDLEIFDNENNNNNEVNFNNLDFTKSKLSLVDEYTKKYENEINNNMNGSSKNKEINLQKIELMNLFKKIMHSLDSLSNSYFIPKPVLLNGPNEKIATLHIEENTPIILSEKNKKAPEENYAPGHVKTSNEMSKQERKSLRKLKKMKRKKKILSQFKQSQGSSTGGIAELQKRNNYLMDKNKKSKEEKTNIAKYGVSSKDQLLQKKIKNKYDYNQGINNAMAYDAEKRK